LPSAGYSAFTDPANEAGILSQDTGSGVCTCTAQNQLQATFDNSGRLPITFSSHFPGHRGIVILHGKRLGVPLPYQHPTRLTAHRPWTCQPPPAHNQMTG
jgi:hypothetical protein